MTTSSWIRIILMSALLLSETFGQEDEVCIAGYVVDIYCIDRGTLLDDPSTNTLEEPSAHTAHCLIDVPSCIASGYEVLASPVEGTIKHSRAFRLDEGGNQKFIKFAKSIGKCTDCTGTQVRGLQATLIGTVEPNTGSSTIPETFAVTSILPFAEGCGDITLAVPDTIITSSGRLQSIIFLHAGLMLTSWGLLLPSGVLMARLLRHRPSGLWFKLHRSVQVSGLTVAIIGVSIALANFSVIVFHGMLGLTVMVLGIAQPINAILRPHATEPGKSPTTKRTYWERLHKGVGYTLVPLSAVTIVFGTLRVPVPSDKMMLQIVYGVIVALLVFLGLAFKRDKSKYTPVLTHEEREITPTAVLEE